MSGSPLKKGCREKNASSRKGRIKNYNGRVTQFHTISIIVKFSSTFRSVGVIFPQPLLTKLKFWDELPFRRSSSLSPQ